MDTVFAASFHPKDRIQAKVDLWHFLQDSLEDFHAYKGTELATEIIGAVIYTLHPHYSGPELIDEARLVLQSLNLPIPESYTSLFANTFQRIVSGKIKSGLKHKSG